MLLSKQLTNEKIQTKKKKDSTLVESMCINRAGCGDSVVKGLSLRSEDCVVKSHCNQTVMVGS